MCARMQYNARLAYDVNYDRDTCIFIRNAEEITGIVNMHVLIDLLTS